MCVCEMEWIHAKFYVYESFYILLACVWFCFKKFQQILHGLAAQFSNYTHIHSPPPLHSLNRCYVFYQLEWVRLVGWLVLRFAGAVADGMANRGLLLLLLLVMVAVTAAATAE